MMTCGQKRAALVSLATRRFGCMTYILEVSNSSHASESPFLFLRGSIHAQFSQRLMTAWLDANTTLGVFILELPARRFVTSLVDQTILTMCIHVAPGWVRGPLWLFLFLIDPHGRIFRMPLSVSCVGSSRHYPP
jgi:hypothetical protein